MLSEKYNISAVMLQFLLQFGIAFRQFRVFGRQEYAILNAGVQEFLVFCARSRLRLLEEVLVLPES